jgi:hypothetical protein
LFDITKTPFAISFRALARWFPRAFTRSGLDPPGRKNHSRGTAGAGRLPAGLRHDGIRPLL